MTATQVLKELESLGTEQTRKVLRRHGARDPFFGVRIGDMQALRRKVKTDYQLALDLPTLKKLLARVRKDIHKEKRNDVRWAMNNFVICVGCYVTSLSGLALETAEAVGDVEIDWGETGCRTPNAPESIRKIKKMNRIGKKRKTAKC